MSGRLLFANAGRRGLVPRLAVSAVLVAVIGVLDFLTGLEIRIFPLYFAPVAYAAAGLGARPGIAVAVVCTSVWLVSTLASGNPHATWLITTNAILQFGACAVIALMVARMRVSLNEAESHAYRDALTGLANRYALVERSRVELARLGRGAGPLVMACLDLDNFKLVNDREGHSAGDRVLQSVAHVMQANLRTIDLVARIGGDEFVLMLPEIQGAAASAVLERVRAEVASVAAPVTATLGAVVLRPGQKATLDEALKRADAALYRAKRAGKNRIALVQDDRVHPPRAATVTGRAQIGDER
jgi:diguanylate cyclase (GGDEF)-like protein